MGTFPSPHDPSGVKVRVAHQDCQGAEAPAVDFTYFPLVSSVALTTQTGNIPDPTLRQGAASPPKAGAVEIIGDIVTSTAPDATLVLEAVGLQKYSAVTDEGGGAYSVLVGPSQASSSGRATVEVDNGDGSPIAFYNYVPATITWSLESQGMFTTTFAPLATIGSRWALSAEAHASPFTGRGVQLRGVSQQNIERSGLAATARDVYLRLIKNASATATPRWIAIVGRPGPLTGTVEMTGTTELQGTGTSFATEIHAGDLLDVGGNFLEVVSVASDTSATLSATATVSAGTKALREYGTALSIGKDNLGFDLPVGLDAQSLEQYRTVIDSVTGLRMGHISTVGHAVEGWLYSRAGLPTLASTSLTGTFSVTAGSNVITGSGSSLVTETEKWGEFTTAGGQVRRITAIASATSATVDKNFTTTEAGVAGAYIGVPTFDLSGTWTAAASSTLTGSSGAALTEVVAGQWLRAKDGANQGVVARVVSVTDDDTIVVHEAVTIAAATTLETDVEFKITPERTTWTPTSLAAEGSGSPAVEFRLKLDILDADGTAADETIETIVTAFSIPYTTGFSIPAIPIGTAWASSTPKNALSSGQASVTIEKQGDRIARILERRPEIRVVIEATSGVRIGTSNREHSKLIAFHGTANGSPIQAAGADDNLETLLVDLHPPSTADADYPDIVQVKYYTNRSNPLATTALT